MTLDKQLVQRVIDVLDLELDVSLDDKRWDEIIDQKLGLQQELRRLIGDLSCPPCHGNCFQGRNCPARSK